MTVPEIAPHTSLLITAIAATNLVICAVVLGAALWVKLQLTKGLAASYYALTAKLAEPQGKVGALASQLPTQREPETEPTPAPAPKKIDHAIALAELGANADAIQQETGLPEMDVLAIIRFHAQSEPSFQETLAAQEKLVAVRWRPEPSAREL